MSESHELKKAMVDPKMIETGMVAAHRATHGFGRIVSAVNPPFSHVDFLSRENGRTRLFGARKGWSFRRSFIAAPFDPNEESLARIVRLRYDTLFDAGCIGRNIESAHRRAYELAKQKITPYDWPMIFNQLARFVVAPAGIELTHRRPLFNPRSRYECSEAVSSYIWAKGWLEGIRTDALSLFARDPKQFPEWDTPTDIGTSPHVEIVWDRRAGI